MQEPGIVYLRHEDVFLMSKQNLNYNVSDFVYHRSDAKTEKMKLLIVEDLGSGWYCCRYIHYKDLHTNPHRKLHETDLVRVG